MTREFLGVKKVTAWPQDGEDGRPGYAVKYEDGYTSWSPKEVFARAYFPLGDILGRSIAPEDIEAFIGQITATGIGPKTVLVKSEGPTGFVDYETASCVDPANFDLDVGMAVGADRIKQRLWDRLGFVLQWALYGFKPCLFDGVRRCRVCGCTDDQACEGGCYWVEPDLCSACVETDKEKSPS